MPWTAKDAPSHTASCTTHDKCAKWSETANGALESELKKGTPREKAEGIAIATANGAIKESVLESFAEDVTCEGVALVVDKAKGQIRNVKILGIYSKNGRQYSPACIAKASPLYEGKRVNVDHNPQSRSYRDRIGHLSEIVVKADGLYGTLNYNPKHAVAEQLEWDAEHNPNNVGLSHDSQGFIERVGGVPTVTEIKSVRSVDLVGDPATNRGLFESEEITDESLRPLAEQVFSALSDIRSVVLSDGDIETKRTRLGERLASLQAVVGTASVQPLVEKVNDMEIKDITLAQLKEHRSDLIEQLTGTDAVSKLTKQVAALTESVAAKETELASEKAKVTTLEGEKKALVLSETIATELKAAKIDPSNKTICTEALMTVLREAKDADARKPIVALMATAQASTSKGFGSQGIVPLPEGVSAGTRASTKAEFMGKL